MQNLEMISLNSCSCFSHTLNKDVPGTYCYLSNERLAPLPINVCSKDLTGCHASKKSFETAQGRELQYNLF